MQALRYLSFVLFLDFVLCVTTLAEANVPRDGQASDDSAQNNAQVQKFSDQHLDTPELAPTRSAENFTPDVRWVSCFLDAIEGAFNDNHPTSFSSDRFSQSGNRHTSAGTASATARAKLQSFLFQYSW